MVLVLSEHFTRWRDAIAIPDGTTETIANVLDQRVYAYFALPERIPSDQGLNFESKLMHELCQIWQIEKSRTTTHHPQGNGAVEGNNKDLGNALQALLLHKDKTDWDLLPPHVIKSSRAMPHSSTGESANFLVFGRELNPPETAISGHKNSNTPRNRYAAELVERLEQAYDFIKNQQNRTLTQDTPTQSMFAKGYFIWTRTNRCKKGTSWKLQTENTGPYKILAVNQNGTYLLDQGGRHVAINGCKLKLNHLQLGQGTQNGSTISHSPYMATNL